MKKMCVAVMSLVLFLSPLSVAAEAGEASPEEGGAFGTVMLGGGVSYGRPSQLEAGEKNETISSLEDTAKKETEGVPLVTMEVGYLFDETGTWVSMDVMDSLDELETSVIGNVTVGQSLGDMGSLALSYSRMRTDVWEDPYVIGTARKKTKSKDLSFGLSWEELMGLPLSLDLFYTKQRVSNDVSGKNSPSLARDGEIYDATLSFPVFFGVQSMVMAGLGYGRGDFNGESNSYDGCHLSLMHFLDMGRWSLSSSFSGGQKRYDATHPVFGKTRKDMDWLFSTEYTLNAPLGYEDFFFQLRGAMGETSSNISFFESSTLMLGAGVGYKF